MCGKCSSGLTVFYHSRTYSCKGNKIVAMVPGSIQTLLWNIQLNLNLLALTQLSFFHRKSIILTMENISYSRSYCFQVYHHMFSFHFSDCPNTFSKNLLFCRLRKYISNKRSFIYGLCAVLVKNKQLKLL